MRVLVVDDSRLSARVVQGLLESLGCNVTVASNGSDAVTTCVEGGFALVFMDVRMPGLDGCAAAREIRRREGTGRRTPIVALTAEEMREERERCLEAGMDDALVKPVDAATLAGALERWAGIGVALPGSAQARRDTEGTAATPADADPIDPRALDELRVYLGPRGVAERVVDYLENLERRLRSLRSAWDRQDSGEVTRLVHGLKGTSGFVGARRLAGLCREVEESSRGSAPVAAMLIEAIEQEGRAVTRWLEEWQRRAGAGGSA